MSHPLLQPVRLGGFFLRNCIVMAPLTRCRADNPEFVPTDLMATYYAQRAAAGLIVSEGAIVSPRARGYPATPGIWSAAQIDGWKKVTNAVHDRGGLIVCQLWHCGRLSLPQLTGGPLPVAPSAIDPQWTMLTPDGPQPTVTPHALTRDEIREIVGEFGQAARNAAWAGFDGIEIHSSNGYLIHQFFAAESNQRDDDYGGSHENRARFFFEVLEAVGQTYPYERIGFRLNPMMNRWHGMAVGADTMPMWEYVVLRANDYGLAYLHLTEPFMPDQLRDTPHAVHDVAEQLRPIARMPLISNGGFTPERAASWVSEMRCEAVAFGRPWIANPDLVTRIERGATLNTPDLGTFYQGGERGYTDYPTLQ